MKQKCTVTLKMLQIKINYKENFVEWTSKWQVSLNINKCKILSVHHRRYSNMGVAPNYVMNNIFLEELKEIKDLGVC